MFVSKLAIGAVLLALASLSSGCGHAVEVGGDRTLQVSLSEYHVLPQSVRVSAGSLTIVVHNYGRLAHNLVLFQNDVSTGATKPIWPGQSAQLTVTLSPGTYLMASTILSDQALGAYGTLTVTS
jgi:uncharacterized cupredoxin-like copper-binding protein